MKTTFNIAALVIILSGAMGCKKETCYECGTFTGSGFTKIDEECGKDLTFAEAYLTVEQRNPGINGLSCEEK